MDGLVDASLVGAVPAELGRHRRHRFPARGHVVKVLYDDGERAAVGQAASLAGLRPRSYVAAAALMMAQQVLEPPSPAGEAGEGLAGNTAEGQGRVVWSVREGRELLVEPTVGLRARGCELLGNLVEAQEPGHRRSVGRDGRWIGAVVHKQPRATELPST